MQPVILNQKSGHFLDRLESATLNGTLSDMDARSTPLQTSCRNHCATHPKTNGSLHHSGNRRHDILLKSLQTRYLLFPIIFFRRLIAKTTQWRSYNRFPLAFRIRPLAEQEATEGLWLRDIVLSLPKDCGLRVRMSRDRSHRHRIE